MTTRLTMCMIHQSQDDGHPLVAEQKSKWNM
eukprot:CAMPEP_0171822998 /NCGR_PEP_ID=MMETSP0992-20121227/4183_1 /TAXON_ID=483369 /ORGANISM="non described non described, Strain CCMP2098" /LENGTH=30 /DNA_ID= /DNA_START= /DNA_END= /DNA_ORIENTATION=